MADASPASSSSSQQLLAQAEAFVKEQMAGQDGSHDWLHVERVRRAAREIAQEEGVEDLLTVELAATLHDVGDYKYSGSHEAGHELVAGFLAPLGAAVDAEKILRIVDGIGFRSELAAGADAPPPFPELACVQDADRLDAIGAVGIARCFTYGGRKNRALYDPEVPAVQNVSAEEYGAANRNSPSINHFHEKLLLLKDLMKTAAGRRRAQARHDYMVGFLEQFGEEIEGRR